MARRLVWSKRAQQDLKIIFDYWNTHNGSKEYSKKLASWFDSTAELMLNFPQLGKKTNKTGVRLKLVKDYWMVYLIDQSKIVILKVWDVRRNPEHFAYLLKKLSAS